MEICLIFIFLGVAKGISNQSNPTATVTTTTPQWHQQQQTHQRLNDSLQQQEQVQQKLPSFDAVFGAEFSRLHESHLTRTSVIFGLTKVANESNVNDKCESQLRQVQHGILRKQPWAMKGKCGEGGCTSRELSIVI